MRAYAIYRLVRFQLGSADVLPVSLYDSAEEAAEACSELDKQYRRFMNATLRDGASDEPMDLKVSELLFSLGIQHIGHQIFEVEVHHKSKLHDPKDKVVPLRPMG